MSTVRDNLKSSATLSMRACLYSLVTPVRREWSVTHSLRLFILRGSAKTPASAVLVRWCVWSASPNLWSFWDRHISPHGGASAHSGRLV